MNPLLLLVGVTLTGTISLAALYAYQSVLMPRTIVRNRIALRDGLRVQQPEALRTDLESRVPILRKLPLSAESREGMRRELERAGVDLRVNEYLALRVLCALVAALVVVWLLAVASAPAIALLLAGFGASLLGWLIPRFIVSRARQRRADLIEEQLPDALTAIAKSLRAGTGLMGALAYAAEETPAPLGPELQATMRELQLGRDAIDAFPALAARVENADLDIAVTAILIQRSVGGNLSEILTNVSETIRERFTLQREIRVITSRQRLTGNLTALVPVGVALLFILVSPDLGNLLFTTTVGRIALAVGIGFELLGLVMIRKFADIEV